MKEADPSTRLPYRPDIDGLRAVAILAVLGFHAFPSWAPGGFVGVDIFFVISGYLITGILLSNLQTGRFSIVGFYARRIRRIFPALLTVLTVTLIAGYFILWPGEYRHLGKHAAGGAAFIVNFLLAGETGYFDGQAESKPLLHLWSLGVEEQFYIFWPLMLAAAWKWKHRAGFLIGGVIIFSFAANIWLASANPVIDFYAPLSRFWELMAGAALAWVGRPVRSAGAAAACSFSGAGLIALALFALNKDMAFPAWFALLPVAGACLLIAAGRKAWVNREILSHPLMVGIGLISYPLYLWHWPLLSLTQIVAGELPFRLVRLGIIAVSFVLAFLTYCMIEQPVRRRPPTRQTILPLAAAMLAVALIGVALVAGDGWPSRFTDSKASERALDSDSLIDNWQQNVRLDACHLQDVALNTQAPQCVETARPLLLLWGDSHAASLYPGLKKLQNDHAFGIAQLTQSGCPPLYKVAKLPFRKNCNAVNRRVLTQIWQLRPELVMLDAAWIHEDYPMKEGELAARLDETVKQIRTASPGSRIIVIGPMPRWLSPLPALYRRSLTFEHRLPPQRLVDHLDARIGPLDQSMRKQMTDDHIAYLSPQDLLCTAAGCLTRLGEDTDSLTFIDQEHVSAGTADFVIRSFAPQILSGLGLAPAQTKDKAAPR